MTAASLPHNTVGSYPGVVVVEGDSVCCDEYVTWLKTRTGNWKALCVRAEADEQLAAIAQIASPAAASEIGRGHVPCPAPLQNPNRECCSCQHQHQHQHQHARACRAAALSLRPIASELARAQRILVPALCCCRARSHGERRAAAAGRGGGAAPRPRGRRPQVCAGVRGASRGHGQLRAPLRVAGPPNGHRGRPLRRGGEGGTFKSKSVCAGLRREARFTSQRPGHTHAT